MRWRAQLRRAAMLLGGAAVPVCWLLAMPAAATVPTSGKAATVTVNDVAEAWYASTPIDICTTPLGCPPDSVPSASPYPADTLHVGVAGGEETARSYLLPDLSLLSLGDQLLTAVMTVPVDASGSDGTASADTAHLIACLVTEPFTDGQQGSTQTPPKTDCSTSAAAKYDAKKSVFTVDLGAMAQAWSAGALPLGIALVPDAKSAQPTDAWQVTIDGRKRTGTPHVQTVISYTAADLSDVGGTTTTTGTGSTTTSAPPPASVPPAQLPPPSAVQPPVSPPVVAGQQPPTTTLAQQPAAYARTAPPSIAFVAPLLLLAGGVFFARVFTRDATPLTAQS